MQGFKHEPHGGAQSWAERIRSGNRRAFECLFREHYEALCRFALGYVDQLPEAEDLVQDVFFDLWEKRRTLDVEYSLRAYLYGMTRHHALKHLRRRRVRAKWTVQGEFREASATTAKPGRTDDALQHKELEEAAEQAVAALPQRRRQIFVLSRRHGLTYPEIAEALGISVNTVETQIRRALKFLRKRLAVFSMP